MANLCSRDCATTESQTIPLWKRRYPKQGSYVGRARQAQGVYPECLGAATLHSLSWDPSSLTLILIFRHLGQLQPLTKNTRSLVILSTSISQRTERRGKAKPETRSLPWLSHYDCQNGWSQQEKKPQGRGMLKPQRKPGTTAPLWPEQSYERSEMLKYGQICDQTAPTFAVNNEHHPPFPSDALQQLRT